MRLLFAVLFVLLLAIPCSGQEPPVSSRVVRLVSGKEVRVYSIGRITFLDKSHPPSLMLRYETALEPKDSEALRAEAREVWEILRPHAEAAGDSYAMVRANEPIRGLVSKTQSFTYGFIKKEDGQWQMREPKK